MSLQTHQQQPNRRLTRQAIFGDTDNWHARGHDSLLEFRHVSVGDQNGMVVL